MSSGDAAKLETFLIVAYRPVRKQNGKVFKSIKRRYLPVVGDSRLRANLPVCYYKPRLLESGDFMLSLRMAEMVFPTYSPTEKVISAAYDHATKEYVHCFRATIRGRIIHEETLRSKTLFGCFYEELQSPTISDQTSEFCKEYNKLMSGDNVLGNKDGEKPYCPEPFTLTFKHGAVYYKDSLTAWTTYQQFIKDIPIVLGTAELSDFLAGSLTCSGHVEEVEHSDSGSGSGSSSSYYGGAGAVDIQNWMELMKTLLWTLNQFKEKKETLANRLPLNDDWVDHEYLTFVYKVVYQLYEMILEPNHDLVMEILGKANHNLFDQSMGSSSNIPWSVGFGDSNSEFSSLDMSSDENSSSNGESSESPANSDDDSGDGSDDAAPNAEPDPAHAGLNINQRKYLLMKDKFVKVVKTWLDSPVKDLADAQVSLKKFGSGFEFHEHLQTLLSCLLDNRKLISKIREVTVANQKKQTDLVTTLKLDPRFADHVSGRPHTEIQAFATLALGWVIWNAHLTNPGICVTTDKKVIYERPSKGQEKYNQPEAVFPSEQWLMEGVTGRMDVFKREDPEEGNPEDKNRLIFGLKKAHRHAMLALGPLKYLVPSMAAGDKNFKFIDLSAKDEAGLLCRQVEGPEIPVTNYHSNERWISWIIVDRSLEIPHQQHLQSKSLRYGADESVVSASIMSLVKQTTSENVELFSQQETPKSLESRLFVLKNEVMLAYRIMDNLIVKCIIYMLLQITPSGYKVKSYLLATPVCPLKSRASDPIKFFAHKRTIFSLSLGEDTSGMLVTAKRHCLSVAGKWNQIPEITSFWPTSKFNQFFCRWSHKSKVLRLVNWARPIDWNRGGSVPYFEFKF